jgi:hypothetical protein
VERHRPPERRIAAVITSLGYEEQFVKAKDIDVEKERKAGMKWLEEHKKAPAKSNGHGKPKKKRK